MGRSRWLAVLTCITAVGVATSRPDGAMRLATGFVGPLLAQQTTATGEAQHSVPDFVPGDHELSFNGQDDVVANPPAAAAVAASPPVSATPEPTGAVTTTAAVSPPVAPAAPPVASDPPAPASPSVAAAKQDTQVAATTPSPQVITIEPDPTLVPPSARPVIAAKTLFAAAKAPAKLEARAIGTYARGCLAGSEALPVDGPAWQAMRLSRNRNWGHPKLIKLVERLALESQKMDGWPGLLVGDISQPRGGPMLTGHASHQVGLDADVWLTPMPDHRLTKKEREEINATSMLDSTDLAVDPKIFTESQVKLIKRAASYPDVERVFVHPAIKKALCEAAGTDRQWLGKVRPMGGHYYHFHIRIACPPGSTTCKPQVPPTGDDGCGKEVQQWLARLAPPKTPPPPKPPGYKPPPPKPAITLAQLPKECTAVLETGPDGVDVPAEAKVDLKAIAHAPAALKPHLRKLSSAKN